jgi:YD repeat-containing protein
MSSPDSSRDALLERLAEEFVERHRRGERPALSEYADRHPELAAEIRDLFPALVQIEHLKPVAGDLTGSFGRDSGPADGHTPERLGEYRILREVGHGGMGVVYEAEQESLGRHVALKVLPRQALLKATYLERFRREAKAAARLHHTNIVPVFGVGEADGTHYYAMQFIRGEGLDKVLADLRRLRAAPGAPAAPAMPSEASVAHSLLTGGFAAPAAPPAEEPSPSPAPSSATVAEGAHGSSTLSAGGSDSYYRGIARVGLQVADALAYAHRQGILHRDVKPSNLLLDQQGTVWITDFGLAKAEGTDDLTQTGDIVGTIRFMAPERFDGRSLPQSDVYSLGLTLYELLTLRPAFDDTNKGRLIEKVLHEPPAPPRRLDPHIPRDLETIVLKCLAKEPAERYATAEVLADDLRRFLADRPIKARRTPWHERTWRWCRRNPVIACLLAAVALLLSLVAVISSVAAVKLRSELQRAESAEHAEKGAKQEALVKLWDSYLSQARASRMTHQPGQRFATLRAIQEAIKLPLPEGRSLDELRTEAIAALCLPDLEVDREWKLDLTVVTAFTIADTFERYAFADRGGNVSVRRLEDHAELCRLPGEGPLDWYDTLRFSPDGRFLVQQCHTPAGWRHRLWKLDESEPRVVLAAPATAWDLSPDSRQCAVFDHQAREMRIHDSQTGRELRRFRYDGSGGGQLRWNPVRPTVAQNIPTGWRTIDVETGQVVAERAVPGGCTRLAWHPEGRLLAVTNDTRKITIWDTQTLQLALPPLEGHRNSGIVLRFNHAGDLLLSNDWSGIWRLWDVRTGKQLLTQPAGSSCLCFRADDGLVGADMSGGRVRLFRLRRGSEFQTLVHRPSSGTGGYWPTSTLDAEGRLLAINAGAPYGVVLVDVLRGEQVALLPGTIPLRFEARGEALWTYGANGVLRWPFQADPADRNKRRVGPPQRMASASSTDGWGSSLDLSIIAIPNYNRGALLWQRSANRTLPLAPQGDVRYCAVSPDSHWVATGSHNTPGAMGAKVWDAQSAKHVADLPLGGGAVRFSPDSKWLLTSNGGARIWRTGTWKEGPALGSGSFGVLSPDSELLALEDAPGLVRLVRTATGKEVARLTAPEQTRLSPQCFTPNGSHLITVGRESLALHIFDLRAIRQQLRELGLDWSDDLLPSPADQASRTPLDIRVVGAEQAGRDPMALNNEAWQLVTGPAKQRDPAKALKLIQEAVKVQPNDPTLLNTLGVVQYRNGLFKEAAVTLEKSLAAGKGEFDAFDLFFLALCHAKLGAPARAKDCFDRAVRWMEAQKSLQAEDVEQLKAFRAEAEAALRAR